MDYKNYLEEIKELLWSTWYTKEIEDHEFNSIKVKLEKLYKETQDAQCLWLLTELSIHKSNSLKRSSIKYALDGLAQDYNNSGLHDNFVVCSDVSWLILRKEITIKLLHTIQIL
jgi:hypothetical protein